MRVVVALLGVLALLAGIGPAMAEYPDKPIRIVAPYAPGGNIDVADLTAATSWSTPQELSAKLAREEQTVVPLIKKLGIKAEQSEG